MTQTGTIYSVVAEKPSVGLKEGKEMSEEDLREKILDLLNKPSNCKTLSNVWLEYKTDQILTLIREAGYKSPEEYRQALWDRNLSNRDKMMGWDK